MDPATIAFIASLGIKGLGSIFGGKAKKKKAANQRAATTAGLNIRQKQSEDSRRARLQLGASLLNGVPGTTAGGGVNTNVGLDPELVKQLGVERTYDFGSAVPDDNVGGTDSFLSGLFGGIGDTIPYLTGDGREAMQQSGGMPGAGGGTGISSANGGMSIEDLMKFLNTRKPQPTPAPTAGDGWVD